MFSNRVRYIAISAVVAAAAPIIGSVDHLTQGVAVPARSASHAAEVAPALSATIEPSIFGAVIRKPRTNAGYEVANQFSNAVVSGAVGAVVSGWMSRVVRRPAASTPVPARGSADSQFDAPTD